MTVKKRLILSNVLVILLSIIFILLVFFVTFLAFFGVLGVTVRDIEQRNGSANNIQTLSVHTIDKYCRESDPDKQAEIIRNLRSRIHYFGFTSRLYCDGVLIYDDLEQEDNRFLQEHQDLLSSGNAVALENDTAAVVHYHSAVQKRQIQFDAVSLDASPSNSGAAGLNPGEVTRYVEIYTAMILICGVAAIFFSILFIANRTSHSIIKPLNLLRKGSQEIKNGNLDYKIYYKSKGDEFEQVCADFDEMRIRLKSSVRTQMNVEKERKQLIAGISHDLRSPLTAIKGYVEGLRDGVASTPQMRKRYLQTIYRKACDMDNLVDKLFLFARLDSGQFPFNFEEVPIRKYLNNFFTQSLEDYRSRGLDLQYTDCLSGEEIVRMDLQELNRVLANILNNSVKYKIGARGVCRISARAEAGRIILTLQDNGCGVDPEDLEDIFNDFFRTDRARENPGSGSGLGLAIARHIIKAHDGRIYARSGDGLTIIIELPYTSCTNGSEPHIEKNSDH